jgi:hypothetical protein
MRSSRARGRSFFPPTLPQPSRASPSNQPHGDRRKPIRLRRFRRAKVKYLPDEKSSDPTPRTDSDLRSWFPRVLQYCSANDLERDRARKKAPMSALVFHLSRFRIDFGVWGFELNRWLRGAALIVRLLTVFGSKRSLYHSIRLLGLRG